MNHQTLMELGIKQTKPRSRGDEPGDGSMYEVYRSKTPLTRG